MQWKSVMEEIKETGKANKSEIEHHTIFEMKPKTYDNEVVNKPKPLRQLPGFKR